MTCVSVAEQGATAVVRLTRPPVNAITLSLCDDLVAALESVAKLPPRAGVVLTGEGSCFCAGADLKEVPGYDAAQRHRLEATFCRTLRLLIELPVPVVGALNGHAIGGGLVLALACDRRWAAEGPAEFGFPEAAVGIPFPPLAMAVIQGAMNPVALNRLVLDAGARWQLERARAEGLVDVCLAPDRLLEAAIDEARRLARAPGFGLVKRQLRAAALAIEAPSAEA
jgi:enoyl-CoA hydratase